LNSWLIYFFTAATIAARSVATLSAFRNHFVNSEAFAFRIDLGKETSFKLKICEKYERYSSYSETHFQGLLGSSMSQVVPWHSNGFENWGYY
jgi:hypothetical protein